MSFEQRKQYIQDTIKDIKEELEQIAELFKHTKEEGESRQLFNIRRDWISKLQHFAYELSRIDFILQLKARGSNEQSIKEQTAGEAAQGKSREESRETSEVSS